VSHESEDRNYAGAIYGTIISMAVITTASKDASLGPGMIAGWAAATAFIFWLAHVYADIVAQGYARPREARVLVRRAVRREWPLVQGALIPCVPVVLAGITSLDVASGAWAGVITGVAVLFASGLLIGGKDHMTWGRRVIVGSINASFGLIIVVLKVWVH